jgi:molybdopterin-guanine dinucleotide biosynthesis protein B
MRWLPYVSELQSSFYFFIFSPLWRSALLPILKITIYIKEIKIMRAIGIIGFSESGKTSLGIGIAKELTTRGFTVAAIKHTHAGIDISQKDTALYAEYCASVTALSETRTMTISSPTKPLNKLISSLHYDFVIVEGFKDDMSFPKIICKGKNEEELTHDLMIAMVEKKKINNNTIKQLCTLIENKAFFLGGLDCKKCGFSTCGELAKGIINGKYDPSRCKTLHEALTLTIDDEQFLLNPFVSSTLRGTIIGFLQNLKGYKKGKIVIEIT